MATQYEFKRISKRASVLVNLEENFEIEFKESLNSLSTADLVSFANSRVGGAILIGVKEKKVSSGKKIGEITGCRIGEEVKRQIISKANNCLPAINVDVFYENTSVKPFIRIEIPSGLEKPYCTQGGIYSIRDDGQRKALHPGLIFQIFLEKEYETFAQRFHTVTEQVQSDLEELKFEFDYKAEAISDNIDSMSLDVEEKLRDIYGTTENAERLSDDAMLLSDEANAGIIEVDRKVEGIENNIWWMSDSIAEILKKFDIEDPHISKLKREFQELIKEKISKSKGKINIDEMVKNYCSLFVAIKRETVKSWAEEVLNKSDEGTPKT